MANRDHEFRVVVHTLRIRRQEIADRYECRSSFVQDVLAGRAPMPARMRILIETMIEERKAELAPLVLGKVGAA